MSGIMLPKMSVDDLYVRIRDKEEITKLALYSQVSGREAIALIDEKLPAYYA